MAMQDLKAKYDNLVAEAIKAVEVDRDIEKAKRLRAEAVGVKAMIDEYATLRGMAGNSADGTPLVLPGTQNNNGVNSSGGSSKSVGPDNARAQFTYLTRFGQVEDAIKAILTDLHGENYEMQYLAQKSAFGKYVRFGPERLTREETDLLKTVIVTPKLVREAFGKGIDTVSAMKATMVETIGVLGGYAVPVDFQTSVIERMAGLAQIRSVASVDTTSRDMVEYPTSTGGTDQYSSAVRVTWVEETPTAGKSATNLTFGLETLPIYTMMAETGLSRNVLEDSAFNVEDFLSRKFAEAATIDEDNKFAVGNGLGVPQGILPGGGNVLGLTEKVSGGASTLTWDGLIGLTYAIASQYRRGCRWMMKRSTIEAIAKLKDSNFGYLWNPYQYQGGREAIYPAPLLGFQIVEQESMPDIAASAYPIAFGDFKGYQIFDRVGMTVERFLDSATARQNMIMFVMRRRLGAQLVEPWRFAVQKVAAS